MPGKNLKSRRNIEKAWLIKVREKIVVGRPDSKLQERIILREFDCSDRKIRILTTIKVYRDGNEEIEGRVGPWVDIGSEISNETLYRTVCTH